MLSMRSTVCKKICMYIIGLTENLLKKKCTEQFAFEGHQCLAQCLPQCLAQSIFSEKNMNTMFKLKVLLVQCSQQSTPQS